MSLLPSGAIESAGYNLTNSLRFRSSASAYLSRTPASAGNRQIYTWSGWVKRGNLTSNTNTLFGAGTTSPDYDGFRFNTSDQLQFFQGGAVSVNIVSTPVYRDTSAWYHVVLAVDTTQATAANRVKIYINGSQVTAFGTANYPAQNASSAINNTYAHGIAAGYVNGAYSLQFDGYMAEVNFIDGQALTPSSFGETDATTGVWKAKKYTGTYGTNGFYLNFSSIATTSGSNTGLGKDYSGNGNYWNTNNISVTAGTTYDAMTDVPTNTSATVANYATLNPLDNGGLPVAGGNLNLNGGTAAWYSIRSTIAFPSTGKYYWEYTVNDTGTNIVGILDANGSQAANAYVYGTNQYGYGWQCVAAVKGNNNVISAYGSATAAGDVIMIAFDADNRSLFVGKNGTWFNSSNPATNTSPMYSSIPTTLTFFPVFAQYSTTTSATNFGQRPFTYTPPTGYVALNTYNLPTPTILQGNKYMDATLYTGNGTAGTNITNTGSFYPSFTWIKKRSAAASHTLFDTIRGATNFLVSDSTGAETTAVNSLTAFNSNGFTLGNGSGVNTNDSGSTYVAWQWNANNGSTSSNTDGSITSTVSVNTTAGFSIVTYTATGANGTVGHGLGVAPKMIIAKRRTSTGVQWLIWHTSLSTPTTAGLFFTTGAQTNSSTYWNSTLPTSTVFSVGTDSSINVAAGDTFVAYCWADVSGYSKAFSYTGNASTDGPFVFCNFSPKFVIIKRTDSTGSWFMVDTSRNTYNLTDLSLYANLSDAEGASTSHCIDILSNGFKCKGIGTNINASGGTYIGMAFASNPFKNSLAR